MNKMVNKNSFNFILDAATFLISFGIFFYIFLSSLIPILIPNQTFIDIRISNVSYLRYLSLVSFALVLAGWLNAIKFKKLHFQSPLKESLDIKIIYFLTSFFLAVFYSGFFTGDYLAKYLIFFLIIGFFFFFLPQIIAFYTFFNFDRISYFLKKIVIFKNNAVSSRKKAFLSKQLNTTKFLKLYPSVVSVCLLLILISLSLVLIINISGIYLRGEAAKEHHLKATLYIKKISPSMTTNAEYVKLEGYNFGFGSLSDKRYDLMTDKGPIRQIEYWDEQKIVFIVPLHLEIGKRTIWVQKPKDHFRGKEIIKSNQVYLLVFSRFVINPDIDDTKFFRVTKKIKKFIFFHITVLNPYLFKSYE